jgi:vanillate O-demethylase monooxygenase subunit
MFLRNSWYVAATTDELGGGPFARTFLEEPVVLFRDASGRAFALEDRCCHRGAPLSLGWVSGDHLTCGYHGLVFDGHGACVDIPAHHGRIPDRARVRAYPVIEKNGFVWIWMGEPAKASEDTIPDLPHHTAKDDLHPRYAHGVLHVKADYTLFLENLMDLTHLAYIHKNTIGSHAADHAGAKMETIQTPSGVKYVRWMFDAVPPPGYKLRYGFTGLIDRWEEFEYVAPASVMQFTGAVDAGTGAYDKGNRDGGHNLRALHTFTPETETSCFYFFSFVDGYRGGDKAESNMGAPTVLQEDARMIEQQQLRLNGYDRETLLDIPSDVARVQMTRLLNRKIAEEQAQVKSQANAAAE